MKLRRLFLNFLLIFAILLSNLAPTFAATEHKDGQIRVRWSTTNSYLSPTSYIEHEIIPTETGAFIDGAQFRWTNQYHFDFCWQGSNKLTAAGNRCGYVGFGLGSKNGLNYYGNFDFAIFNSVNVTVMKNQSNVYCNNSGDAGYIDNTQTFYMNCWKGVVIQMGTPYILRVQWDESNTSSDNNWWSATLTNKKTNESITIGKIKAVANAYDEPLSVLETVVFYQGDAVACDQVPIIDLRVAPPKTSNSVSSYLSQWNAPCIRAKALPSKDFAGYYSIKLGGANPESRETGSSSSTGSTSGQTTKVATKPKAPIFSGIKISGNTLNINVNLNSSQPDIVYLVAPKLTGDISQKILADISGDNATWSIKFDPKVLKGNIPISFLSVKGGESSAETKINYLLPASGSKLESISSVPAAPTAISSKVVGENLIVTAKIVSTGKSATSSVSLYSNALNINRAKALKGDLLNNSVVFSIPVTPGTLSKKIDLNLFASNKIGSSKVVTTSYSLPIPKSQSFKTSNQNIETTICVKGPTVRTFASKTCPPGWQTK